VLVVDDEHSSREVLSQAIESWGYDICLAHNGEEAVSVLRERSFPVVIIDVVMPGLDGIGLLRILKRARPETDVIMVTAYGSINDAVVAIKEGAIDFLTKPLDYSRLRSLVGESLGRERKPRQESGSGDRDRELDRSFIPSDSDDRRSEFPTFQQRNQPTLQQRLNTGTFPLHGGRFRGPGSDLAGY